MMPPDHPKGGDARERFPVTPETVTVNGYRYRAADPAWIGLDFAAATVRDQATIMVYLFGRNDAPYDLHLRVPFCHPEDQPCSEDELCYYRVRARAEPGKRWRGRLVKDVAIEPDPGADPPWQIIVTFAGKPRARAAGIEVVEGGKDG